MARNLESLLKDYGKSRSSEDDFDSLLASYEREDTPVEAEQEQPRSMGDRVLDVAFPVFGLLDAATSDDSTSLDQIPRAATAGVGDIGADLMFRDIDAEAAEKIRLRKEEQAIQESSLPEPLARFMLTDPISPTVAKVSQALGQNETYRQVFGSLSDYVSSSRQQVEADVAASIERNPIRGRFERAGVDFAGSALSSAASIPGGAFAAIPAVIQKNDSYRAAREAGADPDDAEEYANLMAAAEGGISAIPTARLYKTLTKPWFKQAEAVLAKKVAGTGLRTLSTMAGEAVEEGVTQVAQEGINQAYAAGESSVSGFAEKERSKTFGEAAGKVGRAAGAGALGGGLAAPHHSAQVAFEKGLEFARTQGHALEEFKTLADTASIERQAAEAGAAQDEEAAAERQVAGLESEIIFDTKESMEAQDKADEEEAMFRNQELRAKEAEMADSPMGRAMIKGFEWTPEMIAKERQAAQAKQAEADEATARERYAQEESTRRLREDMARLDAEEAAKKAPLAEADMDTLAKAGITAEQQAAMEPEDARKLARQVEPAPAQEEEAGPTDKDVRDMARAAGLNVADPTVPLSKKPTKQEKPTVDFDDYKKKLNSFLGGLVNKNNQQATDVRSLINQRKMVVAPNPESIGRTDSGEAMFDPKTGKMYVYLDRINPEDTVGNIAAAVHESTHGGQYNARTGRGRVLESIFAKSSTSKLKQQVKAAYGKNTLATQAVDSATEAREAAAEEFPHLTEEQLDQIEGLELMAYFSDAASQPGTKGRLRGAADALVGGVRSMLRNAGVDMDVTLNDVAFASRKIIGEMVKTDMKPTSDSKATPLAMIAGKKSPEFERASKTGRVYKGDVDQKERFEIPDTLAETADPQSKEMQQLDEGKPVKLDKILRHDRLFDSYPELKDLSVVVKDTEGDASYWHDEKEIRINPLTLAQYQMSFGKDIKEELGDEFYEDFRGLLLHEVQHAVQRIEGFVPGANTTSLIPAETRDAWNDVQEDAKKAVQDFPYSRALDTLDQENSRAFYNELQFYDLTSMQAKKEHFIKNMYYEASSSPEVRRLGEIAHKALSDESEGRKLYAQAEREAFKKYLEDYGEAEARNTTYRSRKSIELLDAVMPQSTLTWDDLSKDKGVKRENLRDTYKTKKTKKSEPAASEGVKKDTDVPLAMARRQTATPEPRLSERERVRRIVEHGTRSRTADLKIAEDLDSKYKRAMAADKKDVNDPKVHKEILDLLTHVDNADGAAKTALWKSFQKKYPNTSKVLETMRNRMDALAKEFLESKLNSGKELNKQEIEEVMEVLHSRNRYLPRAFSALQPQVGKAWAGRRYQDYLNTKPTGNFMERVIKKFDSLSRRLNPRVKDNVATIKKGIEFFEKKFVIPADDVLVDLPSEELATMYEDHVGPIRTLRHDGTPEGRRDALLSTLHRQRDLVSPETLSNMAENAVREMLGLSEEPDTSATVKAFKKAFKSTEKLGAEEKPIPKELATLMGEIQDPAGRVLITLAKQSALMSRAKMLGELYNDYQGELVLPKSRINEDGMREKFSKQLNGQHYGPLDGFYATPALADKLKASYEGFRMFDEIMNNIFKVTQQLTRKEKIAGIVIDPINWATNFSGSGITLLMNGNFSPVSLGRGLQTARDYWAGTMRDTTTEMLDDAQRYLGIEAVEAAEIQHILGDKLKDYLDGKLDSNAVMKALNAVAAPERTRAGRVVIAGYAISDAWAKIANFHDRVRVLKEYYKALGDNRSIEEIKREAGADASFTNFSAERVPRLLTIGDRKGLTKFGGYFAESFRTPVANYLQAKIDIQRAIDTKKLGGAKAEKAANVMMTAATKRLVGNSLATLVMPAQLALRYNKMAAFMGLGAAFLLSGEDDDDELKRLMVSEWNRTGDLIDFGRDATTGKPVFYNASAKLDPIGPATDLIRDIHTAEDPAQAGEAIIQDIKDLVVSAGWMKRAWKAFTLPKVPESELAATFPAAADDFRDVVEVSGFDTSTANKAMYVASSFLPGLVKSWNPKYIPQVKDDNTAAFMAKLGADFETLDPNKAMAQYGFAAKDAYDDARKRMSDSLSSRATLTSDNMMDAAVRYAGEYRIQQLQDKKYVDSLRAWGYKDEEIVEMFKNNGWSKSQAQRIVEGDMEVPISMKSFKEVTRLKKQGASTDAQKEKLDDRYEQVDEWVKKHQKELEKMGIEVTE